MNSVSFLFRYLGFWFQPAVRVGKSSGSKGIPLMVVNLLLVTRDASSK